VVNERMPLLLASVVLLVWDPKKDAGAAFWRCDDVVVFDRNANSSGAAATSRKF
jgi:predicted carbohydrate-binding protein with CBM5 and CBM33 domain